MNSLKFLKFLLKLQNLTILKKLRYQSYVMKMTSGGRFRRKEKKKLKGKSRKDRKEKPLRITLKKEVRRLKKKRKRKKERLQRSWSRDFVFQSSRKGSRMCCEASSTSTCACEAMGISGHSDSHRSRW